jgi:hypothetical protein
MEMNNGTFAGGDDGLAQLEAELATLSHTLAELKTTLIELLEAMQLQFAIELGAPAAGDQQVRLN